mgnify:CR=1 FL=1
MIYVGQNNLQNEYLTFKMADKTHMFFHVQQGPGAHVVVMSNNIDEKLKRFVANIAAYYSSYKNSSTVWISGKIDGDLTLGRADDSYQLYLRLVFVTPKALPFGYLSLFSLHQSVPFYCLAVNIIRT